MRYLISYDIRDGNDYAPIRDALEELGAVRILDSQWAVRDDKSSANELCDRIAVTLNPGDKLLVSCLEDGEFAGWCLSADLDAI